VRPAAACLAILLLTGAGGGGRVVRVDHPEPLRVRVPGGWFTMGVPPDDVEVLLEECQQTVGISPPSDNCRLWFTALERRTHRDIWVDGFWIDTTEVTTEQYRRCARAGGCDVGPLVSGDTRHLGDALPIVNVTRVEAQAYCVWRGGRLPTEAEWEHAARGDDPRKTPQTWPWGDDPRPGDFNHGKIRETVLRNLADVAPRTNPPVRGTGDPDDSDGFMYAAPPGSMRWSDSPFGVHDMAGNVAEWVLDDFDELGFIEMAQANPVRIGPPGSPAMTRGGSWRDPPFAARVDVPSYQSGFQVVYRPIEPDTRSISIGFRCVYGGASPDSSPAH
jgi:iron(II)-dependent oxidoreductase